MPETTTSPLRRMQTASQSISTSLRMWLEKKTVLLRVRLLDDEVADLLAADRIEAAHRLVEDEELRIVDQRRREPGALEHALREARAPGDRSRRPMPTRSMTRSTAFASVAPLIPLSRPHSDTNSRGVRYG